MILIRIAMFIAVVTVPGTLVVWYFTPKLRRLLMPRRLDLRNPIGDDDHSPTGSGGVHPTRS